MVASLADELGLVSHEFGEEEIDRFIIVYKAEHAPSPEEVARLTLKHTHKLAAESVERIIAAEPTPAPDEGARRPRKAQRVEEADDEPVRFWFAFVCAARPNCAWPRAAASGEAACCGYC